MALDVVDRLSAQVISSITDLSQIDTTPEYSFFAMVTAPKGDVNYPYLIQTTQQLEAYFGTPTPDHLSLICAQKIIESGFPGYIIRVASSALAAAHVDLVNESGEVVIRCSVKQKGTDGNRFTLDVGSVIDGHVEILLKQGSIVLDTIDTSYDPDADDFILNIDHELLEFELVAEEISALKAQVLDFTGGNDGLEGITAADYIGEEDFVTGLGSTGMQIFLQKNLSAQFWPSLGVADKEIFCAMRDIADRRKDVTCIFDAPQGMTKYQIEQWAISDGSYAETPLLTGFNCELYWDWLVDLYDNAEITLPPSVYVTMNSLDSYKANGPWYPVAGDSRGKISPLSVVTQIPSVVDRDELVSHRINPIYDTGNRGIQIYGNETLNLEYSDLSAAHIARTLVYIRSTVDEYTETKKFELNDTILWSEWVDHVQDKILAPIKAKRGLQWYRATMGEALTSREELSQRRVRGRVELQFTPDAEVFYIDYIVYASSLTQEELDAM